MDQQAEAKKEIKKRRTVLILGASLFGVLFILTILGGWGNRLTQELEFNGRVLFTWQDRGSYLIVMNNNVVTGIEMAEQLAGEFNYFDRITKTSGSSSIKIFRKDSLVTELEIDFKRAAEIYQRKMEYLDKKRR